MPMERRLLPGTGVERKESSYPLLQKRRRGRVVKELYIIPCLFVAELKSPVPGSLGVY